MNLNDVRLFIKVVEANSFTAAADNLGIQKSTISRRISQLEDDLGIRLLQRTTRKLHLTDDGMQLFERCRGLINELEDTQDLLSSSQTEPQGRLRITMPTETGVYMMNEAVSSFLKEYPRIEMEVELSTRIVDLIEEGIDLAIRVGPLNDSSLIARKIASLSVGLYSSHEYLDKYGYPNSPAELKNHQCLLLQKPTSSWHFENWNNGQPMQVNGRLKANNLSFLREMVVQGLGIARMPHVFCQQLVESGEMVPVLESYQIAPIEIHALYPSRRNLNPRVRLFIDHMQNVLQNHPWANPETLKATA